MVSDCPNLPFFPHYETEYIKSTKIRVTWFEPQFSQSHYNMQKMTSNSNACTLIAVLMATKCQDYNITIWPPRKGLNKDLIHMLALSMLEGNHIHGRLRMKKLLKHLNLNVPEAIKFAGERSQGLTEWKNLIFMEPLGESLFENLKTNLMEWTKQGLHLCYKNLFIILVADSRTVLFIFQITQQTVALVDSHQHSANKGSFISVVKTQRLNQLCAWFVHIMATYYHRVPGLYEISFLYFKKKP